MKEDSEINSIVEYETYLLDKYGFYPFNYNAGALWETIIELESKGKYAVWYKKFIKKNTIVKDYCLKNILRKRF